MGDEFELQANKEDQKSENEQIGRIKADKHIKLPRLDRVPHVTGIDAKLAQRSAAEKRVFEEIRKHSIEVQAWLIEKGTAEKAIEAEMESPGASASLIQRELIKASADKDSG